jgi:hypothetical protein
MTTSGLFRTEGLRVRRFDGTYQHMDVTAVSLTEDPDWAAS